VKNPVALSVALSPRPRTDRGQVFAQGVSTQRALRSLWLNFTPHRLMRRYSDYAWLNKSASSQFAS
jgi:hypothetical protein